MVDFKLSPTSVVLEYRTSQRDGGWVWDQLQKGKVEISQIFTFSLQDLIQIPSKNEQENLNDFTYRFRFADVMAEYYRISGQTLGISNDVFIAKAGVNWRRKLFVAERNISIFKRIAALIPVDQEIFIGGERDDAIPIEAFENLIKKFPNTYELDRYAEARVASIIGEYIQPQRDYRSQYEIYLNKRKSQRAKEPLRAEILIDTEIEKFEFVRNTVIEWLSDQTKSEDDWQRQLLAFILIIFPKYIAVIEKVPIEDRYTSPGMIRKREIDLALVDVNGNIDVIEIKKPSDDILLRKTRYRDNYVPTGELSGTIMQAEKYIFHLGKGGPAAEDKLTVKYRAVLPPGLKIRITNPKAILILGRDRTATGSSAFSAGQLADLEVIKRKYANIIDVITYDDLLRRLENILASLRRRRADGLYSTTP